MSERSTFSAFLRTGLGLAVVAVLSIAAGTAVKAQEGQGTIEAIRVEGNQRIEDSTVLAQLRVSSSRLLEVEDPFDPVLLDAALKSLFDTELFADVTFLRNGSTLVIRLSENPIVNQIVFEGNQKINDEDLASEVTMRQRTVFTRNRARSDVARLLELYQRSGRFAATVVPKAILLDQNRVDLVFEINEGPLTGIERINIIGNHTFGDGDLREELITRESRWWRFLSSVDRYDPDQFEFDQELLRRYYQNNGYPRFRIESATAELRPERDAFFVTITIDEGERYTFGEVEIISDLPETEIESLRGLLLTDSGDEFDRSAIQETVEDLRSQAITAGQPFIQVRAEQMEDEENRQIHVAYRIERGPRIYVERIDIVGNVRTLDRVIRRYLRLSDGDPLNPGLLARSRTLVGNLGYFSGVEFREVPGSAPDRRGLEVAVAEGPTGGISFGAGYSTTRGVVGRFSIQERNLLGRGQTLRLSVEGSSTDYSYSLAFTEPFFARRDVSFSASAFNDAENPNELSFRKIRTGAVVGFGFSLGEYLRHNLSYSLIRTRVLQRASSSTVIAERTDLISSLTGTWTYDRRDSAITPSEGYYFRLSASVAGLGGEKNYGRITSEGGYFFPLFRKNWVLGLLYDAGFIEGIGEDVSFSDRFFLGGRSFRGFDYAGLGPRVRRRVTETALDSSSMMPVEDTTTITYLSALGGKLYAVGTAEMKLDLGLPEELGIHGRMFMIGGFVTSVGGDPGIDTTTTVVDTSSTRTTSGLEVVDEVSFRASAGIGISWASPAGPIRIDLTTPLSKEDYDITERFVFSVGSTF